MAQVRVDSQLRCPYCHDALVGAGRKTGCESCFAWHHAACMDELGSCANCSAPAPTSRAPSLEFERARLNELLATGCGVQGCRSIETVRVETLGYRCQRHIALQGEALRAGSVIVALLVPFAAMAAYSERSRLDVPGALVWLLLIALLCGSSAFLARKCRTTRAALEGFEEAREVADAKAEAEAEAEAPKPTRSVISKLFA